MEKSIALLGDVAVGKTSLIGALYGAEFTEVQDPTINTAFIKIDAENSKNETVYLQVWDTAGQEKYDTIPPYLFRTLNIALICFECNSDSTRNSIYKWVQKVKKEKPDAIFYLVATKSDLLKEDYTEINEILNDTTNDKESPFSKCFRTSSKDGDGIKELKNALIEEKIVVVQKKKEYNLDIKGENGGKEKKCC